MTLLIGEQEAVQAQAVWIWICSQKLSRNPTAQHLNTWGPGITDTFLVQGSPWWRGKQGSGTRASLGRSNTHPSMASSFSGSVSEKTLLGIMEFEL